MTAMDLAHKERFARGDQGWDGPVYRRMRTAHEYSLPPTVLGLANPGIPAVYWFNLIWVFMISDHMWTWLALI